MKVPDWYGFLLLALAAFRVFRLIAEDTILDRPRRWLLRLGTDWQKPNDPVPEGYREKWALFITCPACCGFWVSVAWWAAWQISNKWALVAAVPFAISEVVIVIRKTLDQDED